MTNPFNFDPRFEDQPQSATPHRPTTSATPCRRERAAIDRRAVMLAAAYVDLIEYLQPDLLNDFYSPHGHEGLLDTDLRVRSGEKQAPGQPQNTDGPVQNTAWPPSTARRFVMEEKASDVNGEQDESWFTPDARAACEGLLNRLLNLAIAIGMPITQLGVINKIVQHAVRLAILHRVLRWKDGEFGKYGPEGAVEADDAKVACDAALFFFGRWLVWQK